MNTTYKQLRAKGSTAMVRHFRDTRGKEPIIVNVKGGEVRITYVTRGEKVTDYMGILFRCTASSLLSLSENDFIEKAKSKYTFAGLLEGTDFGDRGKKLENVYCLQLNYIPTYKVEAKSLAFAQKSINITK